MPPSPGDEFRDDDSISADTRILRRIPPGMTKTEMDGRRRPGSGNFDNDPNGFGTSVDIWADDSSPDACLAAGGPGFGLVFIRVGEIREFGLGVVRDSLEGNPNHALIQGRKSKSVQRKLARAAIWIREPATE
jgi:hypothetical protein